MKQTVARETIENRIFVIRGLKVMLSIHLAELYNVVAKVLIQAVKRNIKRFPEDFMFQLTWDEVNILRSQIVTLRGVHGKHIKYLPYAFTEQGVAMLSSVLNNDILMIFEAIRQLMAPPIEKPRRMIGFKQE